MICHLQVLTTLNSIPWLELECHPVLFNPFSCRFQVVPPAAPGSAAVLASSHPTAALTYPASAPDCAAVVGFTPSGLAQGVVWSPGGGVLAYAGEMEARRREIYVQTT